MILITDRRAAASDTLATSYILAQAIRKLARYDLVFCGRQAIDGDTAQVGPQSPKNWASPGHGPGAHRGPGRRRRAVPPQHGPRLGNRRGPLARAGHGVQAANQPRPRAARRTIRFKDARTPAELLAARGLSRFRPTSPEETPKTGLSPSPRRRCRKWPRQWPSSAC